MQAKQVSLRATVIGGVVMCAAALSSAAAFAQSNDAAPAPAAAPASPLTAKVYAKPLLLVPPCINKYYILDLQPANSLVRYAVEQGNTVFLVSWRNPDVSMASRTWEDYIEGGAIEAIRVAREISAQDQINVLGFCVGGTILSTALAVLAARGEHPAASLTLLTTLLDFTDTGILDVFVDQAQVEMREQTIGANAPTGPGLLRGVELANTFSFLRPNDLVWNYVVENYLKGKTPAPFDLLYWNGDSTNLPGPWYCWYLRHTYLQNDLKEPGKLAVGGTPVDLGKIDVPVYIYGSREDHIVPWQSAYASVPLLKGKRRFVLGASGHIAGVINPPAANKRSHWINTKLPETADAWFEGAKEHPGSWWPDWSAWLASHAGAQKAASRNLRETSIRRDSSVCSGSQAGCARNRSRTKSADNCAAPSAGSDAEGGITGNCSGSNTGRRMVGRVLVGRRLTWGQSSAPKEKKGTRRCLFATRADYSAAASLRLKVSFSLMRADLPERWRR